MSPVFIAYRDGVVTTYEIQPGSRHGWFGGPHGWRSEGDYKDLSSLHVLGGIWLKHLGVEESYGLFKVLPLIYGFTHDACLMKYRHDGFNEVEILEIRPKKPSEGWPYFNYPPIFPYWPLGIAEQEKKGWDAFCAMATGDLPDSPPADLVILARSAPGLGVCLWSPLDDDGVDVVFEVDTDKDLVYARNITD